ncbi:MAG: hypothetical protein AABX85_02135 [Nanoarchaeota archaeon]
MKFNFKKIVSVLTSTVMLSSTLAFAAAANFPAPFVKNGAGDVAVVYGSAAAGSTDYAAVLEINAKLNSGITTTTGAVTTITGDNVKLERGSNKFNYADAMNTHFASLDDDELSTVLNNGIYLNDVNTEFKYEQKIEFGAENLSFFHDSQFKNDLAVLGFNMDRNDHILNYTLDFTPTNADGVSTTGSDEFEKLDNTEIEMLGKKYFISDIEGTTNGVYISLLDSANAATISEGETTTVTIGSSSYDVSVDFVEDSNTAKLSVNGETTNSIDEGQTYKLSDGTYVGIKDVSYNSKDTGISKVEFTLGSGKIELENRQEVEFNDEVISETEDSHGYTSVIKAYITNTTAFTVDKIVLEWNLNDDAWLAPGEEIVMPGFNAIKISMAAWNMPKEEKLEISDGGDYVRVTAPVQQGELKLPILYTNTSNTGITGIGQDATRLLVTSASVDPEFTLFETLNSYFVATWISSSDEAESYAYEIQSITSNSGKNTTKLRNLVTGGSDLQFDTVGDTELVGQLTFTLVNSSDSGGNATISVSGTEAYGNLLATKEGLVMSLPVLNVTATTPTGLGAINLNATNVSNPTTWTMQFFEEDKDEAVFSNSATDKNFTITIDGSDTDGTQVTGTSLTEVDEEKNSDWEIAYVASDLATKVRLYNPSGSALKKLEVYYPGAESYADVYVSEADAVVGGGSTGGLAVSDSEIASVNSKNLIVVGGSCVNTVAAKLLGSDTPLCGADWESATGVGAGSFLIQTFASPYASSKIATLVAGYNAGDTTGASKYLTTQTLDVETVGTKIKKTVAETASLV